MNSVKRIFVALGVLEELQKEISLWQKKRADWPVRWVNGENLHITLVSPWYEKNIDAIISALEKLEGKFAPFQIQFNRIEFGSDPSHPRLIWTAGEAPSEMIVLKDKIDTALGKKSGRQSFLSHLTLARFQEEDLADLPVSTLNEEIDWRFEARSFLLMESLLSNTGAEYAVLKEFKL